MVAVWALNGIFRSHIDPRIHASARITGTMVTAPREALPDRTR